MQAHHPRFLYHEGNWVIQHIAISHLANMNRKFKKEEDDSDIEVHREYTSIKTSMTKTARPTRGSTSQRVGKVC
jgi:hypothetical protein